MLKIENLIKDATATICKEMNLAEFDPPPPEAFKYFRFHEIPFLLFFLANKNHKTTIRQVQEQYELRTGEEMSYEVIRKLVRRYYDSVELVKMLASKSNRVK